MFFYFQITLLIITKPQNIHQPQYTPLTNTTNKLKNTNIKIFTLNIKPNIIPSKLKTITSKPKNIFSTNTISSLPILTSQLTNIIHQNKHFHYNYNIIQSTLNKY